MVTSQEIVERSFYISLLHQALIRGLTINPENYLVENEDGLWVPTRELNEQYLHDKEAIEAELTKKGSGFYYIFGVGNNQSRGQKDLPRITLDLTAWYPGEIGLEKETYELDEASGLYQVIDYDYEPKSSRIDVHLCANNQQEMRILHEIMYRALPSRGYIKPYLNDYESWKNSKFSPSGNLYIEVGNFYDHDDLQQGFLEKVYTYEVRDGLLNPEILNETVTPIADISVLINSALTLHVPELPYDKQLIPNVDSIKFVKNARYSYVSHTEPEDYEVDLGSTINTGYKYVGYNTTSIDPYIVPITITQNNRDVTDECIFSFPNDKNIRMVYENGNLIFTVKNLRATRFDCDVVVTKGYQSISIPFSVNFTITDYQEIPEYVESDIFDVTKGQPLTLYGKAVGKGDILSDGIGGTVPFIIEHDAPWPLSFGTLTVNQAKPKDLHLSMADFTWDDETNTYSYDIDEDTTIYVEYKTYYAGNISLEKRVRTYNNIDYYGVQCKGINKVGSTIVPRLYVSKGTIENIKDITINYAVFINGHDKKAEISSDLSNSGEQEYISLNANNTTTLTYTYTRIPEIPWRDYVDYPGDPPLRLISVPVATYQYEWTVLGISDIIITFN